MEKKELISFWETCDPVFSHIEINDYLGDFSTLTKSWENNFISKYDFNDKVVVDYGIGGGFLGQYLFSAKNIKKYIGFDISARQLAEASNNLNGLDVDLYNVNDKETFNDLGADIFISQAVIQHFPDEKYFINFLKNVNDSNIGKVMLQIRYNKKTMFRGDYSQKENVRLACQTNSDHILGYLTNYNLVASKRLEGKSNYEFLFFEKVC
jgi:2-polyprenyl-3-methyl-5-hydroxy-6-metoxy-1,4-benzoquinol methylase